MTAILVASPFHGPLAHQLAAPLGAGTRLFWLGQAGFILETQGRRLLIDPYLSDTLAHKYRDGPFSHERMMPAPITVAALPPIDAVLVTHAHTDHMDPGTLGPLFRRFPDARLVAPRAVLDVAIERSGLSAGNIATLDAGETLMMDGSLAVTATRAAHEDLRRSPDGHHVFLGYGVATAEGTLWHSGDSVPFAGLEDDVRALRPDVALLPVNGRDRELSARGVPGNFTLEEAVALAERTGCQAMIAHHHGLFAFNTCDPDRIDRYGADAPVTLLRARTGYRYELEKAR